MIRAAAFAKVNLGLRVGRTRADGFHEINGVFQSVSWSDHLEVGIAEEDDARSAHGQLVAGEDNLAWRALVVARQAAGARDRLSLMLDKQIAVAAGLGGGSADAAAALGIAARLFDLDATTVSELAETLGSDVPFCLTGGTAIVGGRGEVVDRQETLDGFALAMVVPPAELSTPAVFREWDRLGGPRGKTHVDRSIPPSVRAYAPLVNDLHAAAVSVSPEVAKWEELLREQWGRPIHLSGSGPTLYGFFVDVDEAESALSVVPRGARHVRATSPIPYGWVWSEGATVRAPDGSKLPSWPETLAP